MLGEFGEEFAPGSQLQDEVDTSGDFNNLKITMMMKITMVVVMVIKRMARVNLIEPDKVWMGAGVHHSDLSEKHLQHQR